MKYWSRLKRKTTMSARPCRRHWSTTWGKLKKKKKRAKITFLAKPRKRTSIMDLPQQGDFWGKSSHTLQGKLLQNWIDLVMAIRTEDPLCVFLFFFLDDFVSKCQVSQRCVQLTGSSKKKKRKKSIWNYRSSDKAPS